MTDTKPNHAADTAADRSDSQAPADTDAPALPIALKKPREKSPLWLYVATIGGAFMTFLGFVFLISPFNRAQLLTPSVEELESAGLNASQIADRLSYAAQITPMMLNAAAAVFLGSSIALVFAFRGYRNGIVAYIGLTFVMIIMTLKVGIFTPALLMIPTAVTVTAAMNKEFLK